MEDRDAAFTDSSRNSHASDTVTQRQREMLPFVVNKMLSGVVLEHGGGNGQKAWPAVPRGAFEMTSPLRCLEAVPRNLTGFI